MLGKFLENTKFILA